MTIVREPEGIEFTVASARLTARDRREISDHMARHRQQNDQSELVREAQAILSRYNRRQQTKAREAKSRIALVIPHAVETDVTSRAGNHVNYCSLVAPPTRRPVGGATGLQ